MYRSSSTVIIYDVQFGLCKCMDSHMHTRVHIHKYNYSNSSKYQIQQKSIHPVG